MNCRKCKKEIPEASVFCNHCGAKQVLMLRERKQKSRGNGTGSAYRLPSGSWRAVVTLGYDSDHKRIERTKSGFKTKKEALEYIPTLKGQPKKENHRITFKSLYDKWFPTHRAGSGTMACYKAAIKYFQPVWYLHMDKIDIDDLQDCMDECPQGKRTRQNMKAVCGLIYKFGIPRNHIPQNLNLSTFLIVGEGETTPHIAFTDAEIEKVRAACGRVEYADYIYCMMYTGFRIGEFFALDVKDFDRKRNCLVGGGKTDAGTNRTVTISPKIQPIIDNLTRDRIAGPLFPDRKTGKTFDVGAFRSDYYYSALEACGIESPKERRLTPHSCRRTFATLMKNVAASDKDKLRLMGHASEEMLRYYQDVSVEDLRKITDSL